MTASPVLPAAALGGGGLAHLIVRLLIWRAVWRVAVLIWRVPTIGPGLLLAIVAALVGLAVYRSRRGAWTRPRMRTPGASDRPAGRGGAGDRNGSGPRDW